MLIAGSIEPASNITTIYLGSEAGSDCICLHSVLYCFLMLRDRLGRSFHIWQCLDTLSACFLGWILYGFLLPTLGTCDYRIYTYLYVQLRCRDIYSRDAGFPFKKGAPVTEHTLRCIRQAVWFCRLPKRCRYNLQQLAASLQKNHNIINTTHTVPQHIINKN
jgi:hypothetical protein